MDGVVSVSHNRDSVLDGKSAKDSPDEKRVELRESVWGNHSALSGINDDNISNWREDGLKFYLGERGQWLHWGRAYNYYKRTQTV